MKKLFLSLILIFTLFTSAFTQEAKDAKKATPPPTQTLSADESKQLKTAFDAVQQAEAIAQQAQDRLAARQAEAKALYWQYVVLKKIDIDKWQFAGFDEKGIASWAEKKEENTKKGVNKDGDNSKPN